MLICFHTRCLRPSTSARKFVCIWECTKSTLSMNRNNIESHRIEISWNHCIVCKQFITTQANCVSESNCAVETVCFLSFASCCIVRNQILFIILKKKKRVHEKCVISSCFLCYCPSATLQTFLIGVIMWSNGFCPIIFSEEGLLTM